MDSQSLQKTSILFLFLDLLRIYDVLKTKSKLRVLRFEDLGVLVSDSSGTPFWVTKHDGTHPAIYPNSAQSEAPGAKARPCQNMRAMDVLSFPAGKVWYVCQGNMCNRSGEAEELWRVPKSRGKLEVLRPEEQNHSTGPTWSAAVLLQPGRTVLQQNRASGAWRLFKKWSCQKPKVQF